MAAYLTTAGAFGHLLNRDVVEKGLLEGRIIPPLVEYLPAGSEVELDPKDPRTEKLLASGSVEAKAAAKGKGKAAADESE